MANCLEEVWSMEERARGDGGVGASERVDRDALCPALIPAPDRSVGNATPVVSAW